MRTINVNVVRGHSYENFQHENLSYESFLTRKFPDLRYIFMAMKHVANEPKQSYNLFWWSFALLCQCPLK